MKDEKQERYWIARDSNGALYIYKKYKPFKESNIWVIDSSVDYGEEVKEETVDDIIKTYHDGLPRDFAPDVHWEDKEPAPVYIGGRIQVLKEITEDIENLTEEEQDAVLRLIDAIKREFHERK